ncbi:MAG: BamA/TamA family outer membrane protein [Lewinellaceae bacterium]|nr:BamA/TamA family outer membrane protein [Lewinellaceae bacterium]
MRIALFLFLPGALPAQNTIQLHISPSEKEAFFQNIINFRLKPIENQSDTIEFRLPDSASVFPLCRDLLRHFREKSYLAVSIDHFNDPSAGNREPATGNRQPITGTLHLGPAMHWLHLHPAARQNDRWLEAAGFREKLFSGKPLRYDVLLALEQRILEQAENNGYPFARIGLDSIVVQENGGVDARLLVEQNRFIVFKQLKINGDVKLPPAFLNNYLGIKPGSPYSRAQVLRLRQQLNTLLFLESTANPTVTFSDKEATVNLYLQKKRASRFDFIIGLLPRPDATDGKLLLTGSLSAAFQNALNLGDRFAVEFERLKPETQKLDVQAGVPYVLGTSFGVEGRLNIFRRDSTWVDAQADIGVQYLFTGGDYVKFLWENKSSSLQKVDTLTILQSRQLPANLDLRQNGFGLEVARNRLDYRFNPRRGWSVLLKTVAGFNTVLRNNQIENLRDPGDPEFIYASLYDSVAGRQARFRLETSAQVYFPFFQRSTLKLAVRAGGVFSEKPVFNNEQYRLGGNKLLRGFDEESLFATRFVVATAEWRLLLGQNSFLAAFTDYGYIENVTNRTRLFLRPLGVGAGLNFETQAGIFGISLAAGRRDAGQSLDFRALKFHLGYVSLF